MKDKALELFSEILKKKLVRFFLVSGVNTFFGYGFFALFLYAGIAYPFALLLSTIMGIVFNFKTIGYLVFKNSRNILIFKFFGVYGITYLCNLAGLAFFDSMQISNYIGGAILIIPIGLFSFFLNKTFVFKNMKHQ